MKTAQTKNITGFLILCLVLLFFGEGVFSAGLYWPMLLALSDWPKVYWFTFFFGLLVSLLTVTPLGLASAILVITVFLFGRVRMAAGNNLIVLWILVTAASLGLDLALSLSWSVLEVIGNGLVVFLLWRMDFFDNDLTLRGGR